MGTDTIRRPGTDPGCTSCGDHPLDETIFLCGACVLPDAIGVYCRGCGRRTRLDVSDARRILHHAGKSLDFARPGVVITMLERCPACATGANPNYPQRIMVAELRHDVSVSQ